MSCKFHKDRKAAFALDGLSLCTECANGAAELFNDKLTKIDGESMKTVKDVYAVYKYWPLNGTVDGMQDSAGYNAREGVLFTCHKSYQYSNDDEYKICTREQYEAYKTEQESKVMSKEPQSTAEVEDVNTWYRDQLVKTAIKVNNDAEGKAAVEFYKSKGFTVWGSNIYAGIFDKYIVGCDGYKIGSNYEIQEFLLIEPDLSTKDNTTQDSKCSWYDYENGEGVPPVGTECEYALGEPVLWWPCNIKYVGDHGVVISASHLIGEQYFECEGAQAVKFRPLDHDKYKVKVAPMEWLIGSGIDCEFKDRGLNWHVAELVVIDGRFEDDNRDKWKRCRPRMNHKHVLTGEQLELIPDCFECNVFDLRDSLSLSAVTSTLFIVEFTGLKDGYVWSAE